MESDFCNNALDNYTVIVTRYMSCYNLSDRVDLTGPFCTKWKEREST